MSSVARVAGMAAGSMTARHDEAVSVFPERVAGDQYPVLGVVEDERAHVMPRRRQRLPFEITPDISGAGMQDFVRVEAVCRLVGVVEQQRLRVPARNQRHLALGHRDGTAIGALHGRVAAHVVGVAMRVDHSRERLVANAARRAKKRERERRVPHVPGVDQHMAVAAFQQHVVRGEPVADEDMQLGWQGRAHGQL